MTCRISRGTPSAKSYLTFCKNAVPDRAASFLLRCVTAHHIRQSPHAPPVSNRSPTVHQPSTQRHRHRQRQRHRQRHRHPIANANAVSSARDHIDVDALDRIIVKNIAHRIRTDPSPSARRVSPGGTARAPPGNAASMATIWTFAPPPSSRARVAPRRVRDCIDSFYANLPLRCRVDVVTVHVALVSCFALTSTRGHFCRF